MKKGIRSRVVKCVPFKRILKDVVVLIGMGDLLLLGALVSGR
jgi:hypothetical protein